MKIALLGYGKMGKTIEKIALEKGHQVVFKNTTSNETGSFEDADVAIEFSSPDAAVKKIERCLNSNIPVVCGTTGWLDHLEQIETLCKSCNGSFIYASNFSVGVNLFFELNEKLAKTMAAFMQYSPAMEEIHHTQKLDAPSGTAITLAQAIINNSKKKEWTIDEKNENESTLFIDSIRIGDVKGTHRIEYKSSEDSITIEHEAHGRDGFAKGAILAAQFLKDKKGIYTMKDVLKEL